jgi:hypothetical protein
MFRRGSIAARQGAERRESVSRRHSLPRIEKEKGIARIVRHRVRASADTLTGATGPKVETECGFGRHPDDEAVSRTLRFRYEALSATRTPGLFAMRDGDLGLPALGASVSRRLSVLFFAPRAVELFFEGHDCLRPPIPAKAVPQAATERRYGGRARSRRPSRDRSSEWTRRGETAASDLGDEASLDGPDDFFGRGAPAARR